MQNTAIQANATLAQREWIPLVEYLDLKGCSRSQFYRRADIRSRKIRGRVEVHCSALELKFRGVAK